MEIDQIERMERELNNLRDIYSALPDDLHNIKRDLFISINNLANIITIIKLTNEHNENNQSDSGNLYLPMA